MPTGLDGVHLFQRQLIPFFGLIHTQKLLLNEPFTNKLLCCTPISTSTHKFCLYLKQSLRAHTVFLCLYIQQSQPVLHSSLPICPAHGRTRGRENFNLISRSVRASSAASQFPHTYSSREMRDNRCVTKLDKCTQPFGAGGEYWEYFWHNLA